MQKCICNESDLNQQIKPVLKSESDSSDDGHIDIEKFVQLVDEHENICRVSTQSVNKEQIVTNDKTLKVTIPTGVIKLQIGDALTDCIID